MRLETAGDLEKLDDVRGLLGEDLVDAEGALCIRS